MKRHDRTLDQLEDSIRRLKREYDVFFNGAVDRWPKAQHEKLTGEIKGLFNVQSLSYAQCFRLNGLALQLNTYNGLWQRNLRQLEQGGKATLGFATIVDPDRQRVEVPIEAESDRDAIEHLFQEFCRARERVGNEVPVDPLLFEQLVADKLQEVQERTAGNEVIFVVAVEEGQVHLKTRVRS